MFKIIKKAPNEFWHYYNNDAKKLFVSKITFNLEEVQNTFVLIQANGSNVPANKVLVTDIQVIDETDGGIVELFTTANQLRIRLNQLGYGVTSSGEGGIQSVQAGTNITIDNTDPFNPIISATGGGGGSQNLQQVLNEGNTATDQSITLTASTDEELVLEPTQIILRNNPLGDTVTSIDLEKILHKNGEGSTSLIFEPTENNGEIIIPNQSGTMALLSDVGNLLREEFTFTSSQTFTLANNYGQVYSVEVQGQGALSTSQYTLVSPNQITINDTLDSGDYVVILYSNAITGLQPYYSQSEVDALLNLKANSNQTPQTWYSALDGISVANTLTITPTYTQLIPAGTFAEGDVVEVLFRSTSPGAKTSASSNYIYINTNNDLSGTPIQVAIFTSLATNRTIQIQRSLSIKSTITKVINPTTSLSTDTGLNAAMSNLTIDWSIDQYFIFAIGHTVADQTLFGDFYRIIKN